MDAREYAARKGIDLGHDKERPNTLEEKAWSRAREAGGKRPRAGTPHDWEDWERHHEDLAAGAEQIEQKIDHEAHNQAVDQDDESGVSHLTPTLVDRRNVGNPLANHEASGVRYPSTPRPSSAFGLLAILLPPLFVGLTQGGARLTFINLVLTLLGWLPGVLHALWWMRCLKQTGSR